jgi:hypothetical protein
MATGKKKYVSTMEALKILGIRGIDSLRSMAQRGAIAYAPRHVWPNKRAAMYDRESLDAYLARKSPRGRKPLSYEATLLPVDERWDYERQRKANAAIKAEHYMYPPPEPKKVKLTPATRREVDPALLAEVLKERGLM